MYCVPTTGVGVHMKVTVADCCEVKALTLESVSIISTASTMGITVKKKKDADDSNDIIIIVNTRKCIAAGGVMDDCEGMLMRAPAVIVERSIEVRSPGKNGQVSKRRGYATDELEEYIR